jgi:hypothetical protein
MDLIKTIHQFITDYEKDIYSDISEEIYLEKAIQLLKEVRQRGY